MRRKAYLRTTLLWLLLVVALALLSRPLGNLYRTPILGIGETIAQFAAPEGVQVLVQMEAGKLIFAAGRGEEGIERGINPRLLDISASLFLATVLLTPVGSVRRRALWAALAFMGFVVVMGLVMAGLALVPLVQGGFLTSRIAWKLAALSHNTASSGLIISFPAAIWFLSTLDWWRRGFQKASESPPPEQQVEGKLTRRERRKREREERKKTR